MARPVKQPDEQRSETVRARVTVAEKVFVEDQAERAGLDVTTYIRRRVLGFEVTGHGRRTDPKVITELNSIGNNLNQIARNINSGRQLRTDADMALSKLMAVLEKVVMQDDT